jgi:hypothetical protein
MRKEVDFSKGVRGKHFGKTVIVGPVPRKNPTAKTASPKRSAAAPSKKASDRPRKNTGKKN